MSVPARIKHTGSLIAESQSSCFWTLSGGPINTSFHATYAAQKQAQDGVLNVLVGAPLSLPFENITRVRVGIFQATGAPCTLLLTSAAGASQAIPMSDGGIFLFHNPGVGDEFTAIAVAGTGPATVSYFIAGDVS
jgi:hypothetical protein